MAAPIQVSYVDNDFGARVDSHHLLTALPNVHAQATPHIEQLMQTYQPQLLPANGGPPAFALTKRHGHLQLWLHMGPHQYITRRDRFWVLVTGMGNGAVIVRLKLAGQDNDQPLPVAFAGMIPTFRTLLLIMEQVAANDGAVNPALINNNALLINNNGGEQEEEGAAGSSSEEESEAEESVEEEEVAPPAPLALPVPGSMPAAPAPAPAGPVAEEAVPAALATAGAAAGSAAGPVTEEPVPAAPAGGTAAGPAAAASCAPAAGLADMVAGLAEVVAELAALRVQVAGLTELVQMLLAAATAAA